MEKSLEKFDFQATLRAVGDAVVSVICHILFDFALVGIGVAVVLTVCAFVLGQRNHHFSRPFYVVARRIATACAALAVPGCGFLVFTGHLPASGVYLNFSFGFLVLWSMVTIYLCAEEMNFEWFTKGEQSPQVIDDEETQVISSSAKPAAARSGATRNVHAQEATALSEETLKLPGVGETPLGEDTLKLPHAEDTALGEETLKLPGVGETPLGEDTLKLPRAEETRLGEETGDETLKLPREQEAAGDVTLKLPREAETPVGDLTLKIDHEKELPGSAASKLSVDMNFQKAK